MIRFIEDYKFKLDRKMKVFEDGLSKGLLYEQPFRYDAPISETYSAISADINKAVDECLTQLPGTKPLKKLFPHTGQQ